MTALKERRWELMEVGEEFGPLDVEVTDQLVKSFSYSVDAFDSRYLFADGTTVRTGQPTLLCREARDVIRTGYDIASGGAGMHAKHEVSIAACPEVGQRVRVTGRHVEKYLKREKQYIVLESEVYTGAGALVLRQRSTHIRALRPGVAKTSPRPGEEAEPAVGEAVVGETSTELAPGVRLRRLTKCPTQEQVTVFAGAEWRNIHNDPETAREAGLRDSVASGLQTMAYVSELMEEYCGDGWRSGGHLAVAFTAPLFVGQVVHTTGVVTSIEESGDRRRVVVDVSSKTDVGTKVLAGTADGWLVD